MSEKKNPGGRPTDYKEEYNEQARKLCLLGATDKDLAGFFGVTEQTINNWKKEHQKFFESLQNGKQLADAEVADRLYNRAVGYSHEETKVFCNDGEITEHTITKHYAPDTGAAFIWLKNRQPSRWRDRQEVATVEITHEDWLDGLK